MRLLADASGSCTLGNHLDGMLISSAATSSSATDPKLHSHAGARFVSHVPAITAPMVPNNMRTKSKRSACLQ